MRNGKRNNNTKSYAIIAAVLLIIGIIIAVSVSMKDKPVEPYAESAGTTNAKSNNTENNPKGTDEGNPSVIKNEFGVVFTEVNEIVYTTLCLNIRKAPNLDGEVLFQSENDQKFTRIGIGDNGWDKLKLDSGEIAYASSEYLTTKTVRQGTSGEGYKIAESTGVSTSNTPVDTKHYTNNSLKDGVSEAKADKFFENSAFYGDSVTLGFQNYVQKQKEGFLGGMIVYGMGSYGIGNALKAVSAESIHPIYRGYQTQLWDLTELLKVKKVFMMFGMNDLGLYGVTDSITNYKTLIDAIRKKSPDVQIYLLTTTPMTESYQLKYLNNSNIRLFNNKLRELADSWNVTIIDVASYLMDENGYLKSNFASDGKYHLTEAAYKEWIKVLRSFASYNI